MTGTMTGIDGGLGALQEAIGVAVLPVVQVCAAVESLLICDDWISFSRDA